MFVTHLVVELECWGAAIEDLVRSIYAQTQEYIVIGAGAVHVHLRSKASPR